MGGLSKTHAHIMFLVYKIITVHVYFHVHVHVCMYMYNCHAKTCLHAHVVHTCSL